MEKNRATFKFKKLNLRFRHIYALIMIAVTSFFVWHVFDLLVLTPMRQAGQAPLGYRMSDIEYMEDFWMREVEEFGATLDNVDYVEIVWTGGPVIYIIVHVFGDSSPSYARRDGREIIEYFIEITDGVALQYNLQIVLFEGVIAERDERGVVVGGVLYDNQVAVVRHVHEYNAGFAERTLAHAERYPSQANFDRAYGNINRVLNASILEVVGESGLRELRDRLNAIEIFTINLDDEEVDEDAEEVYMPWYPYSLQIEQSRISEFPNWGAWSNDHNRIIWSP